MASIAAMSDRALAIAARVRRLRAELPTGVRLVAVTKYAETADILAAQAAGLLEIGENRVQDARRKHDEWLASGGAQSAPELAWHLIGHLQTNKVRPAVALFSLIQSIDSRRLAEAVSQEAGRVGKQQEVLLQVNTSGEASKHGFTPEDVVREWPALQALPHLQITGLMTIGPAAQPERIIRNCFSRLRALRDRLAAGSSRALPWLSMGMSDDYKLALAEGANLVRIGRLLFAN